MNNHIDIMMLIYKLIAYSEDYSKLSGSLWQNYRVELDENNRKNFESFKFHAKIRGSTPVDSMT